VCAVIAVVIACALSYLWLNTHVMYSWHRCKDGEGDPRLVDPCALTTTLSVFTKTRVFCGLRVTKRMPDCEQPSDHVHYATWRPSSLRRLYYRG
jgi:hypothetical protein